VSTGVTRLAGDRREDRFKRLYDTERARLIAYALRRTHSPDDAVDVTAEVFTVAWAKLDEIPESDSQTYWLYAVSRRILANRHRKELNQSDALERLQAHAKLSSLFSSRSEELGDSMAGIEILSDLSEPDREILMLAGWEGLVASELACTLGCSPLAARIRLHRARSRLSAAMSAAGLSGEVEVAPPSTESVYRATEGVHEQ
jgi:RNA polymerase sigma-70 factor, ECF subfamily